VDTGHRFIVRKQRVESGAQFLYHSIDPIFRGDPALRAMISP
jgi:hypothetical protein